MDSIEEMSGHTTENNLEFSSSKGYVRNQTKKDLLFSSQEGSSHYIQRRVLSGEEEDQEFSPFTGLPHQQDLSEEIVTLSQAEI